jgi:hypothetical protein
MLEGEDFCWQRKNYLPFSFDFSIIIKINPQKRDQPRRKWRERGLTHSSRQNSWKLIIEAMVCFYELFILCWYRSRPTVRQEKKYKYLVRLRNTHLQVPIQHHQIRTRLSLTQKTVLESSNFMILKRLSRKYFIFK